MEKVICAGLIAVGIVGAAFLCTKHMGRSDNLIVVKGLSEKIVRSDIGEIVVTIRNQNEKIPELYKKQTADRKRVMEILKQQNIAESEIVDSSSDMSMVEKENSKKQLLTRYFKAEDTIIVSTKDLDKIGKLKAGLMTLPLEGIYVTYTYQYKLTNFPNIKLEMMKEAGENTLQNARAFVSSINGCSVGPVAYLRQGEIEITAVTDSASIDYWSSSEKTSVYKKLRLVVHAGYNKGK